jgi:hypothetical protein
MRALVGDVGERVGSHDEGFRVSPRTDVRSVAARRGATRSLSFYSDPKLCQGGRAGAEDYLLAGASRSSTRDVCCSPGITLADQGWANAANEAVYDLLADAEECFLAAFDLAIERIAAGVVPAWESEKEWTARVRAALAALLGVLDAEPALCRLVFVEAPAAGPRVLARRAEVLKRVTAAIDGDRAGVNVSRELLPLAAEAIAGAVFAVIHARLIRDEPEALTGLLDPLIAAVVLPYAPRASGAEDTKFEPGGIRHKEICDVD